MTKSTRTYTCERAAARTCLVKYRALFLARSVEFYALRIFKIIPNQAFA